MTAAVTPLREGDPSRLGSYRLTGLLGEGGQGAVYLGEDEEGRRVAVKLLHARFSGDPKARARFAAEVATAKRVSAFCTARVLDSDVEGDRPYIVSEYIEGPSLSEVLAAGGPLRGAELDRLAIGTMTALAAIHQAGVVHRDFKPANVLPAPDGPRVIDFGIARALDATGTMSSTAVGTPAYMAPEQISGAQVGPAADVFAWGATMVYAACGRPAFGQDSIPAVMHRILNLPPDLGDLGEPLREVVADCLSKDPALRPASPHVLAHLLALAGSLPQPAAGQPEGDGGDAPETAILTRGGPGSACWRARAARRWSRWCSSAPCSSPNCEFPARLAEPVFMPDPEPAGDADNAAYSSRPIGNGPFTLDQYQENRRVMLVRNDSWAFGKTKLDRVVVELGDAPVRGRASYAGGQVDWHVLTSDDVSTAPRNERVTRPGPYTRMLVPVMARGPMKSKEATTSRGGRTGSSTP